MSALRKPKSFGFERFSGLYLWGLFVVIFGLWTPSLFFSSATLHSVASSQAVSAMLAIAVLVPLAAGAYDLSIGATINLSAIIVTLLQTSGGWGMWPAIVVAVAASALIGVINGFIVVKLQVSSFIATLGMGSIVAATQIIVSDNSQPPVPTTPGWSALTQTRVFGFQIIVLYLLILAVIFWWVMQYTPMGRYLYAVGGNSEAARLSGVATGKWTWLSLITSATVAGVAGVFYASLSGPSLTFGAGLLLPAFAAVFLGSTQIHPGRYNVWGTIIAVYVLATGVKGLQLITGVQWLNDMFNGAALIAAVAFAGWRQRRSGAVPRRANSGNRNRQPPAAPPDRDTKHPGSATVTS